MCYVKFCGVCGRHIDSTDGKCHCLANNTGKHIGLQYHSKMCNHCWHIIHENTKMCCLCGSKITTWPTEVFPTEIMKHERPIDFDNHKFDWPNEEDKKWR